MNFMNPACYLPRAHSDGSSFPVMVTHCRLPPGRAVCCRGVVRDTARASAGIPVPESGRDCCLSGDSGHENDNRSKIMALTRPLLRRKFSSRDYAEKLIPGVTAGCESMIGQRESAIEHDAILQCDEAPLRQQRASDVPGGAADG